MRDERPGHMTLEDFRSDYDWREAFFMSMYGEDSRYEETRHNCIDDVTEIIAQEAGENDGEHWVCIVRLADNRYAVINAWCDYTGWDCRAGGNIEYFYELDRACSRISLDDHQRERLGPQLRALAEAGRIKLDWDSAD